jgi:hypothetical protein
MIRLMLRLPDEVHRRLVASAQTSRHSLNQVIVDILSDALGCGKSSRSGETPLEAERRHLRETLGDFVVEYKPEDFERFLGPPVDPSRRDSIIASIPPMDPPLSHAIVEEREESPF